MPIFSRKVKSFFRKLHTLQGPHHLKQRLYFCGILLTALFLTGLFLHRCSPSKSESEAFRTLAGEIASYELQNNGLSLHYTLADCNSFHMQEKYGLDAFTALLPLFSQELAEKEKDTYYAFFASLKEIPMEKLSEHEQFLYRILYTSLEHTCEGFSYPYYYEPLSPSSGEQNSLLILLAEYRFRTKEDVEHYLTLLSCIPDYFDSLLLYEQQKADAGLFMSDSAADKLISQCDSLCTEQALTQHTHFLQTTFESRLTALLESGAITSEEADDFIARNHDLLLHQVSPAYTALADGIFLLKGSGHNENGLCFYESGTAYYKNLLASVTGSDRSPEEILQLLRDAFSSDYLLLCNVVEEMNARGLTAESLNIELPFASPEEMLIDLRLRMQADFPALSAEIDCEVSAVDDALSPYVSPAFYLIPPTDDYTQNHIYINYGDHPDSLTLYTTLAHEGYPGHLFQTVYHLADMNEDSVLPLEGMLSCSGYVEGWATYVEDLSYEYAADVLVETCGYSETDARLLTDFYRLDRRLQLCLFSMLDISIHYNGMTKPEAVSLLNAYGITDTDTITWIYEYIVEEPACYLKYYLGYLEIISLKEAARTILGDSYSDPAFHTFLLDAGSAPFAILSDQLQQQSSTFSH